MIFQQDGNWGIFQRGQSEEVIELDLLQTWNTIILLRLDDEGGSEDVYKHPVTVKAEYDPKVSSYFEIRKAITRPTLT